jgi:CPA2 family monovalent cation:H+ antiporter-2
VLDKVSELIPGLGAPVPVPLDRVSPAVGKTLAQLGVRASPARRSWPSHAATRVIVPSAGEVLRAGDVLALAGTHEAVAAAVELLTGSAPLTRSLSAPAQSAPSLLEPWSSPDGDEDRRRSGAGPTRAG